VNANGTSNIWVANSNGTGVVPLTRFTIANASSPAWSPNGSKIAFNSTGTLNGADTAFFPNIWAMNADGAGAAPVTRSNAVFSEHPSFSPDGARLAFLSNRALDGSDTATGGSNLWIANVDGSGAIPLTRYSALNVGSTFGGIWSPDGRKLAFESTAALDGSDAFNMNSTKNLWVAKTDGSGAVPLTRLAYSSFSAFGATPTGWSPDGNSLAFTSDAAIDNNNIPSFLNAWVIKADGSGSTPLTTVGGTSPAWKP
jgi:Tol biopolymer transport system component